VRRANAALTLRAAGVQAMALVGGIAALSWELIWQLEASLAFGVSAAGTALTLAASMGGMTVGALAMGAWLRGTSLAHPLRLYGGLELVIGLSGLLMLPGFRGLEALDARVFGLVPALAPLLHALGMALLLAPATLAMGATIPVFQLVAPRHATSVSALYGMNTAGAAVGVLVLSFWLLPSFGVSRSCALVAALNVAVFLVSRIASRGPSLPQAEPVERSAAGARPPVVPQLVVFCTGLATFGLEVAWFRALRAAFWSTSSSFAIMLAAVLIPLAVGARIVPWLRRRGVSPGTMLACAGTAILLATPGIERMDLVAEIDQPYAATLAIWLALSLAVIGPSVLCLATALPWFLDEFPEPGATGRLYGLNTLGSVAGSLLAAWGLLPHLGFARSAWALALLVLAASAALHAPRRRWIVALLGAAALFFAAELASSPGRDRMLGERGYRGHRVLAHEEDPDFTASVIELPGRSRVLYIDGFSATTDEPVAGHYMHWMGSLPALLHPDPEHGLVICFGTGQTANALRENVRGPVDVVEISRAVLELAPLFDANRGVLEDPRVRAIEMDGRAWLRRTDRRYDVITLEPMPPNFSGVNSLYSLEFYEIMARRLNDGGVVAQWLPIHLLTVHHAASVAATFQSVFPDAALWYDPIGRTGILVGRREGAREPLGSLWPGLARDDAKRSLSDEKIRGSLLLNGSALARYAGLGSLITDDNQLLQFSDLRAGLRGERSKRLSRQNREILAQFAGLPAHSIE